MDIVDGLTSQYTHEIGPARDRDSSQRHEKWVFAAGGAVRGLKTTKDGQAWVRMRFPCFVAFALMVSFCFFPSLSSGG